MGKGRDSELIKLRNVALCKRYIYWSEVRRIRPDDVLKKLSEKEFFISEERILKIIRDAARSGDLTSSTAPTTKKPHLTAEQFNLFSHDTDFNSKQIRRDSRTDN